MLTWAILMIAPALLTFSRVLSSASILTLFIFIQHGYALACGQIPPSPSVSYERHVLKDVSAPAGVNPGQNPIRPITITSEERSVNDYVEIEPASPDVTAGASNVEAPRRSAISGGQTPDRSVFDSPIRAVGDKIYNLKTSLGEAADEARNSIVKAFRDAGQLAAAKLRDSELYAAEKFRPLVDAAANIFEKPGTTDKQRWDQLAQRVESMGFNNADKREFYQKLADATNQNKKIIER